MTLPEFTYPVKRFPNHSGERTFRQFILPIRIRGEPMWGVIDTGANVSILPKPQAEALGLKPTNRAAEDSYAVAGILQVPYISEQLTLEILEPDEQAIHELDIERYDDASPVAMVRGDVLFQVPHYSYPELAQMIDASGPVEALSQPLGWVILGVEGVIESLNMTFVRDNAVTIQSYGGQ